MFSDFKYPEKRQISPKRNLLCKNTEATPKKWLEFVKKRRAKAKYLPNGLKHKEKSHRSITGPRDLGPKALWVYPGPFYCFFRGVHPSDGVKKWFEALTEKFLPFVVSYISNGVCEI